LSVEILPDGWLFRLFQLICFVPQKLFWTVFVGMVELSENKKKNLLDAKIKVC
jgi:hypothetical protein